MTDPFNRLGIGPDSTADAIKRAYRRLAKECHPDVRTDKETAAEEFRELTKIYETALAMMGKVRPKKVERPPPPKPTAPIVHTTTVGLIDTYEFSHFGAATRFIRVPRAMLEYGGTVMVRYGTVNQISNAFQFEIPAKTKAGQTFRFNMPIGIVEILLVPEG